jgi:hypothetical protein
LKDLATLKLNYQKNRFKLDLSLFGANPQAIGYDYEGVLTFYKSFGFVVNTYAQKSYEKDSDLHTAIFTDLYGKVLAGIRYGNLNRQLIQFDYGYMTKDIRYKDSATLSYKKLHDDTPCFDMIIFSTFTVEKMTTMISYKLQAPYFQSVASIDAFYQLPYNNRILAGISHTYRDKSFLKMGIDPTSSFADGYETTDNLLDAYAGLQITRQFDIRFTLKNITDQQVIFGTYLMPMTYLLGVRWDFVN